jgi:serine/threonine protein kinase
MTVPKGGELLRGYKLLEDFRIVGGGTCQWTFATKDGGDFFVKMFLDPRFPTDSSLGSETIKAQKRERCRTFERHQRDLMERVRKIVGPGGNLVAPIDFFEHGGYYFKIARKVTVTPGAEKEICTRLIQDRITLCINVCSALQSLHSNSIVHGDLKLDNILLQKSTDGGYLAKVIDFDSSYVVGEPPSSEEILGDPPYYSPELLDFIQERGASASLTTASDIFSLGIVFCEYMTGQKPAWTGEHNYLAEAVRAGEKITIPAMPKHDGREDRLVQLISQMIATNPSDRPSLFNLKIDLMAIRDGATGGIPVPPPPPPPPGPSTDVEELGKTIKDLIDQVVIKTAIHKSEPSGGGSRLRGTGIAKVSPATPTPDNTEILTSLNQIRENLKKIVES